MRFNDPTFIANRLEMSEAEQSQRRPATNLKKLVLNHNQVDWASLSALTQAMPQLEELHLSHNGLKNPQGKFQTTFFEGQE